MNPDDPTPTPPDFLFSTSDFTFLGMPSQQIFADFVLWEYFFCHYEFNQLIELGSGYGGFSLFLLLQCMSHSKKFTTYDIRTPKALKSRIGQALKLEKHFVSLDILTSPEKIVEAAHHPLVIFCDNGNKPREVAIYTPLLDPGDFVIVHDWNREIYPEQIPDRLELIDSGIAEKIGSITRFFLVQ